MDSLADNIATACPLPFGGASGSVFLNAITAVVAAHCALFADYGWPTDKTDEIFGKSTGIVSYDFVIVGAGTAGSLVASKLSNKYPHLSVLLIEAGEDPGIDSEIPAFLFRNQNSSNDWYYKTEPDGRTCMGYKDNSCIWNKGKCMGGSSSINVMLYIRGHPKDFDDWNQMQKADWGYDDLKYHYESVEKKINVTNSPRIGYDGWYNVIDEAWTQLQYKSHKYDNYEGLIGTKKCYLLTYNGKRLNTAKIFLHETTNLHVIKSAIVQNIIIDGNVKQAKGVKVTLSVGFTINIMANKEVILSAGSIATPQILMLSGIGPKRHLEEIGIKCHLDLPVGQNLQDHVFFPLFLKTNQHVTLSSEMTNFMILQYMLMRDGPISNIGIGDFFGFLNTKNKTDRPNIQFHHMYFTQNDEIILRPYVEALGYKKEIMENIIALNKKHDMLGIYPTLLHPKSKGEILLRDDNWKSKPVIRPNYLRHPDDMQSLIEAIEFIHKLEQTEVFKALNLERMKINLPNCLTMKFNTRPYWECYIRHMASTVYHPVGTAKMGNDDSSVVNHNLLVHGMKNLRIIDASIMPSIPGANTMATTLAIAHKGVDIILKHYSNKVEL